MGTPGFVLVCALNLLGRSAESLPPIVILDTAPVEASSHATGFVRRGEPVIYLIASSPAFRSAMEAQTQPGPCQGLDWLRLLASVIVHEQWHLDHNSSEVHAYYAQLTALQVLGVPPGRWPYETVRRSLVTVRETESRRLRAARQQLVSSR